MAEYNDYPKSRDEAHHTNDDMVCFFCGKPVSEINGILENHELDCKYRLKKEALLAASNT